MTADVIPFTPEFVGDGATLQPDDILDAARGKYRTVVIVGETDEGEIHVCGTAGQGDTLLLLQWASSFIVANHCERS